MLATSQLVPISGSGGVTFGRSGTRNPGWWGSVPFARRRGPKRDYFLALSASAASPAVGVSPPSFWAMLMSDSVLPAKTSSMTP